MCSADKSVKEEGGIPGTPHLRTLPFVCWASLRSLSSGEDWGHGPPAKGPTVSKAIVTQPVIC